MGGQTLSFLRFSGAAPPADRGCNGATAPRYLSRGAGESGGACRAGRSALCLGMAGPPGCLGGQLSGLLSVSTWLLAPGGQRAALSAFSGAHFLFGRENSKTPRRKCSSSPRAFSLFCWLWLVGKRPCGVSPTPLSPPWSPGGDLGHDSKPHLASMVSSVLATGDLFIIPCGAPGPAWRLLSAPRACGSCGS